MARKIFIVPRVLDNGWGGEGGETGGGSGGTSEDPTLVAFDQEWYEMYGDDYDGDNDIDFDDYVKWWDNCHFDHALWSTVNPDLDYPW